MTILVTGAAGQVGRECVERGGSDVIGLDRKSLDLRDTAAIQSVFSRLHPRVVINAAAYTAVDKAESEPEAAFAINRDGTARLTTACEQAKIPLIHISTDYVFDGSKTDPYIETDAVNPLGVYGKSKQQGEAALRQTLAQHLILRTSWVFGRYGPNFVKSILRLAREKPELRVVADQYGAPTHAGALADVLLALARRAARGESLPWGTYHYCGAPFTSWHGFAETIISKSAALGLLACRVPVRSITTAEFPTPAQRPANTRLDCALIQDKLDIRPAPWQNGLDEVLKSQAA